MPWNLRLLNSTGAKFLIANTSLVVKELAIAGSTADKWVRANADFQRRSTPSLKDSTRSRIIPVGTGKRRLLLRWPKPYSVYIEHGTGPWSGRGAYTIRPRRARALRFMWRGQVHFASRVTHPGIRPRLYGFKATMYAYHSLGKRLLTGMTRVGRI